MRPGRADDQNEDAQDEAAAERDARGEKGDETQDGMQRDVRVIPERRVGKRGQVGGIQEQRDEADKKAARQSGHEIPNPMPAGAREQAAERYQLGVQVGG